MKDIVKEGTETILGLEQKASLLKERIYATIILLAVLFSLDAKHSTPEQALLIVVGATVSVWGASVLATQMSRRIVMENVKPDDLASVQRRLREHTPLLAAGIIPTIALGLAAFDAVELAGAINFSIFYSVALMLVWSLLSARSLRTSRLVTIIITGIELLFGVIVIGLKLLAGH